MPQDPYPNHPVYRRGKPVGGASSLGEIEDAGKQLRESDGIPFFFGCLFVIVATTVVSCCGVALLIFSL